MLALAVALPALAQEGAPEATTTPGQGTLDPAAPAATASLALSTELFNAARDLMSQGRYAEACPKLVESAKLEQRVGTLGKLAECEERLGHLVSARARWQQAINLARAERDDRLDAAQAELARVDALVPKLRFVLAGSTPSGLSIQLDSLELGAGVVGIPVPADPGRHTIVISAPEKKPWRTTIDLAADGAVTLVPLPELSSSGPKIAVTSVPDARSMPPMRALALVAGSAGAVGLGVGAYFGGVAISKLNDSNTRGCVENQCTREGAVIRNEARSAGNLSTAFLVTGGALAAGAVALWFLTPDQKTKSAPRVQAAASAGPQGGNVVILGSF